MFDGIIEPADILQGTLVRVVFISVVMILLYTQSSNYKTEDNKICEG